jgi:TonB family protein
MIKVSIVVLLGLAASVVLRRRSAALRHFVLAFAIVCAAMTPILQRVAPEWGLAIGSPLADALVQAPLLPSDFGQPTDTSTGSSALSIPQSLPVPSYFTIWLAGVLTGFSLLLASFLRLTWSARRSQRLVEGPWADALAALRTRRSIRPDVRLLLGSRSTLLFTWGLVRPAIVLPRSAADWPAERIRAVLGHELAHIQRNDWAIQIVAEILRAVYWFNPLVWLACHRLRQESEQACDDAVLQMGVQPPEYATHLIDVARALRRNRGGLLPAPAMARRSQLERRVRALLNAGVDRRPLARWAGVAIAAVLLGASVSLAGFVAEPALPAATPLETAANASASRSLPSPAVTLASHNEKAHSVSSSDRAVPSLHPRSTDEPARVERTNPRPTPTRGQQTAALGGTLMDATGRFIPGVPMALIDPAGRRYETQSDGQGRFTFAGLPAGEYQVEIRKPGFLSRQGRIVLSPGQQALRDLVAQIGALEDTIVVSPKTAQATAALPRPRPAPAPVVDPCAESQAGGCLTPPRKLLNVPPAYPQAHAANGVAGKVEIEAVIGTDGYVRGMQANEGADPEFAASAIAAIEQWQFSPVRLGGVPQECRIRVTVLFQVAGDGRAPFRLRQD